MTGARSTAPAYQPLEGLGAATWSEDPRTFLVTVSRKQFRELPLRCVLIPTLGSPVLVFEPRRQARAACLASQIEHQAGLYRRAFEPRKRAALASYMRRLHLQRVGLAIGYTWPGNPPGYIEFGGD